MPDNKQLVSELLNEVTRELDLGEYADVLEGKKLSIQVNPPSIVDELAGKSFDSLTREQIVKVVAIFTGADVAKLDDALLYWIYGKSLELFNAYHLELKKNSERA